MTTFIADYAYVPHHKRKEFEDLGWEYENDLGPPHSCYSSLYRWKGEGAPVYPSTDLFEKEKREREMQERAKELRDFDEVIGIEGKDQ